MSNTEIKTCTCKSAYQDARYGKGKRVHNIKSGKGRDGAGTRCTVCGTSK